MDDDASTGHGAVTGEMNRLMTAPARDLMTTLFMIFFSYSWALFFFLCVCVCVCHANFFHVQILIVFCVGLVPFFFLPRRLVTLQGVDSVGIAPVSISL